MMIVTVDWTQWFRPWAFPSVIAYSNAMARVGRPTVMTPLLPNKYNTSSHWSTSPFYTISGTKREYCSIIKEPGQYLLKESITGQITLLVSLVWLKLSIKTTKQFLANSPEHAGTIVGHGDTCEGVVVARQHEGEGEERCHQRCADAQLDDARARQLPALHQPATQERAAATSRHCDHT